MRIFSPQLVTDIARGVYDLETKNISQALKSGTVLGCEGMFKVSDDARFIGKTGGHLYNRLSGFGYIAEGEGARQGELLIAIRGTNPSSTRDWLTDARAGFCRGDAGQPVHIGFQKTWESFSGDIRSFLQGKNPSHIHCVGHSLGGALATLCADYCAANRVGRVSLYTIGSPRVGMEGFANALTEKIGAENIYRISHAADPVTTVPIYPFCHVPYKTRNYVVGGTGLYLNPFAHTMPSYNKAIGLASWSCLLDRSPQILVADEVNRWLATVAAGGGITAFAADSLAMIGKVLGWILEQEYQNWGIDCANTYTALDHLAHMVERGVKFTKQTEEQLKTVMNAILRFIGRSAVTIAELTLAFVQWVLELFYSTIQAMAIQALRGMRQE
ncbi:MAG: lipase family protein [Verrucomicrobia bacterium]|nr:lipase family protein [Verrucomicrobiota bacterium]